MISVCMATYNGARFITEQLDSILPQLGPHDEVIISDDGSTDRTIPIIESYQDSRIKLTRYVRDKEGLAPVQLITTNFENAIRESRGEYIFLSDQDDVWLPNKVKIMMWYLQRYDYVVSDCTVVDNDLSETHPRLFGRDVIRRANRHKFSALFGRVVAHGATTAFRRTILTKALPFPHGIQSHDRWLGYIAMYHFNYIAIEDSTILYRRHDSNASSSSTSKSQNSLTKRVLIRLKYIYELIRR